MLFRLPGAVREALARYRAAVVMAEALVWHHGRKGVEIALDKLEGEHDRFDRHLEAYLLARIALGRYKQFRDADLVMRCLLLERWGRRKGQMIFPVQELVR